MLYTLFRHGDIDFGRVMMEPKSQSDEPVAPLRSVTTCQYALTPERYFRLLIGQLVMRNAWIYLILVGCVAVAGSLRASLPSMVILVAGAVGLPLFQLWRIRRHLRAPENRSIFEPRTLEVTSTLIVARAEDGTIGEIPVNEIDRVVRGADHYLLYVRGSSFVFVPDAAFYTREDRRAFESLLRISF